MHNPLARWVGRAAMLASAASISIGVAHPAFASNGGYAASYADRFAITANTSFASFRDDCTNFVSQSEYEGGFKMVGGSNNTDDSQWWYKSNNWSHSWSVADDYYTFLLVDYPGGIPEGTAAGTATNYYTPSAEVTGDVLFYDWGQGEGISHSAIQTGIGNDPNKPNGQTWYGNYIDQHTTNRYHAFWSLYPYNAAARATTTIYFMHIPSTN